MHLLVDAVAVRSGSAAIVVENLLRGWRVAAPDDQLTVLSGPDGPDFAVPDGVEVTTARPPVPGAAGQLWLRSVAVRRTARDLGVDAVLSGVPASGLFGAPCPRGVILYDLRHELRPNQFTRRQRLARRASWGWSLHRADGIYTISERTLADLGRRHPRQAAKAAAAQLGSDHVVQWPATGPANPPYALAFGHFANKNAEAVIEGWARFCRTDETWRLRLVGMGRDDRAAAADLIERLGVTDRVDLTGWLDDSAFAALFAGAGLVVFPSDFEGFGLPAAEAVRLGIPVVTSADPALLEVTGGHATVARSVGPEDLADAVQRALQRTPEDLAAGQRFAEGFTWERTATVVRTSLGRGLLGTADQPTTKVPPMPCPACSGTDIRVGPESRVGRRVARCRDCGAQFRPDLAPTPADAPAEPTPEVTADEVRHWVDIKREKEGPGVWRETLTELQAHLGGTRGQQLYDVGAGDGEFLKVARDEFGFEVSGNEVVPGAVDLAKERHDVDLDLGDLAVLDRSAAADVVTMWCVLAHVPTGADLLRDVHRLLRPGGLLYLQTPHRTLADRAAHAVQRATRARLSQVPDRRLAGHHLILHTARSITALLERTGFVDVRVTPRARYSLQSDAYLVSMHTPEWAIRPAAWAMDRAVASPLAPRIVLDVSARKPSWRVP